MTVSDSQVCALFCYIAQLVSDSAHIPTLAETPAAEPPKPTVKRHLYAAALSTLLPGAGQLFLGRIRKAILTFVGLVAICVGFWPLRLPRSYPGILFLIWMCLVVSLFAVIDALLARDVRLPGRMSRWWILAGIPMNYVGTNLIFTVLLFGSGFHTFRFGSSSMEPTISKGDKFVVDEHYYHHQPPQRDDLALLRTPDSVTVKRIIAIGGDTIQGKEREILLNGQSLREPFIQHQFEEGANPQLDTFGPVNIPADKYFVMGDNRDLSLDSRTPDFGLLDAQSILGKPIYSYRFTGQPLWWLLY